MDQKKILIVEDNELNMKLFHDCSKFTAIRHCRLKTVERRSSWRANTVLT